MSKRGRLKSYAKEVGEGEECMKCRVKMVRRKRIKPPATKTYFFTEWDYCKQCGHIQHYEKFKSTAWQESEYNNKRLQYLIEND